MVSHDVYKKISNKFLTYVKYSMFKIFPQFFKKKQGKFGWVEVLSEGVGGGPRGYDINNNMKWRSEG